MGNIYFNDEYNSIEEKNPAYQDSMRRQDESLRKYGEELWNKIYLVIVFLVAAALCYMITGCSHKDKTPAGSEVPEIEVAQPLVDSVVIYESYPALMSSQNEADVVARVNGQIEAQYFKAGDNVKKGQVLYSIEPTLYQSSANEAQAQLQSARGQLEYARKHLAALEEGLKANAVSEMDVIQARSALAEAQASVNQNEAALRAANTKLGYCKVLAPISGKITDSALSVGAYVNGDGAPEKLATVYDDSNLQVVFSIPEYIYSSITSTPSGFKNPLYRAVPVKISTSANGDIDSDTADEEMVEYTADVVYESPSVDSSTGNLQLKANVNDSGSKLRAGMYGKVMLPLGKVNNAILVNDASISTDQRGKYLYTVNDSDKVVYTPVKTGELYHDTLRLIKSGLKPGDRYVMKAMISVRNGEKIKPVMNSGNKK